MYIYIHDFINETCWVCTMYNSNIFEGYNSNYIYFIIIYYIYKIKKQLYLFNSLLQVSHSLSILLYNINTKDNVHSLNKCSIRIFCYGFLAGHFHQM